MTDDGARAAIQPPAHGERTSDRIELLAAIDAPDATEADGKVRKGFYAGIVLRDDKVIAAADIVRYMKGWPRDRVRQYCRDRRWAVRVVSWAPY